MTGLFSVFVNSFELVKSNPFLFVPKLLVVFFYSALILWFSSMVSNLFSLGLHSIYSFELFLYALVLLVAVFFDVFVGVMFSFIARDYVKGSVVHWKRSFFCALERFWVVFFALLISSIASVFFIYLGTAFFVYIFISIFGEPFFLWFFSFFYFILFFAMFVLFYLVFPHSSLGNAGIFPSLFVSVKKSVCNLKKVSAVSFVSFFLSLLSFVLALVFEFFLPVFPLIAGVSIFLFFVSRVLVVVTSTYFAVLNPVFYLEGLE
jgi:hypothetical protein